MSEITVKEWNSFKQSQDYPILYFKKEFDELIKEGIKGIDPSYKKIFKYIHHPYEFKILERSRETDDYTLDIFPNPIRVSFNSLEMLNNSVQVNFNDMSSHSGGGMKYSKKNKTRRKKINRNVFYQK